MATNVKVKHQPQTEWASTHGTLLDSWVKFQDYHGTN